MTHFLRSSAADLRDKAVGVILSGMGSDGTPGLRDGLRDGLRELAGLLRSADMRAVDVLEQLGQTHAAQPQTAQQALADAMSALDFERALALCQVWTEVVDQ